MNYDYFSTSGECRNEWENLCPLDEFRVVPANQIPGPLPDGLTAKYDSVVIAASGVPGTDYVFYMLNGHRVDEKPKEIDQMPFGLFFQGEVASDSGCLIQHGNWEGRTTVPPDDFWDHLATSGIGTCYPLSEMPATNSGSLSELPQSHSSAFGTVAEELTKRFHDTSTDQPTKTEDA